MTVGVGFKNSRYSAHGVTSIKFENRKLQESGFRHVESRQSNSVPENQDEVWRSGNNAILFSRSNKGLQIQNESVSRMWHLLARSISSMKTGKESILTKRLYGFINLIVVTINACIFR